MLRALWPALAPLLALSLLATARAESITGVCPDGSVFVVQSRSAVPCRDPKFVDPHEVPPMRPEFLPRPYGWDVFQRETNPNNPYNQVITRGTTPQQPQATAPQTSSPPLPSATPSSAPHPAPAPESPTPTPVAVASARPQAAAFSVSLAPEEITQLAGIVEAWQARAPATLVKPGASAPQGMLLRVAHSAALEGRIADALAQSGGAAHGAVLAFQSLAREPGDFFANLTFVQGHVAFHPDPADAKQIGVLSGTPGPQAAGQSVLGYVVLPANVDLSRPLDVYWDDRRITATLQPRS
ncbi:MAG TPA: hypothetical protein VMW19_20425 [Myxococcota bacterium]|nr:hypothetical protein [Myxococcota bacterium]